MRKGRQATKHSVFPILCGSGASKSRFARAAGAESSGMMGDRKLQRSRFRSQKAKNIGVRSAFGR